MVYVAAITSFRISYFFPAYMKLSILHDYLCAIFQVGHLCILNIDMHLYLKPHDLSGSVNGTIDAPHACLMTFHFGSTTTEQRVSCFVVSVPLPTLVVPASFLQPKMAGVMVKVLLFVFILAQLSIFIFLW